MHRWPTAKSSCIALLVSCLLLFITMPWVAHAQGLRPPEDGVVARSAGAFSSFSQQYKKSTAFTNAMRTTTGRRTACDNSTGSLCGSRGDGSELAALRLAASPQTVDARSGFGNLQVLGPVKDQDDCGIWCVCQPPLLWYPPASSAAATWSAVHLLPLCILVCYLDLWHRYAGTLSYSVYTNSYTFKYLAEFTLCPPPPCACAVQCGVCRAGSRTDSSSHRPPPKLQQH
jgi:hypothetical protein